MMKYPDDWAEAAVGSRLNSRESFASVAVVSVASTVPGK